MDKEDIFKEAIDKTGILTGKDNDQKNQEVKVDKLKLYFRQPIEIETEIGSNITLVQPAVGEIVKVGEERFYSTLQVFTTNPTANRLMLWNMGMDWNDLSDFELFLMLSFRIEPEIANMFFQNIDFSKFKFFGNNEDKKKSILANEEQNVIIDERTYNIISCHLRTMFNQFPKVEKTVDPVGKEWIIEEELMNATIKKEKEDDSLLLPLISSCVNHPGFKYKSNELMNVGIYEFMDSVKRLQVYESSTAVMKGMYSGFVDAKKIDKEAYNFMKSV